MSIKRLLLFLLPVGVLLLLAFWVQAHGQIPYPDARLAFGDHYRYIALARHPFGSTDPLTQEAPFLWRILTPVVVHLLPVSPLTGFWIVTIAGLVGTTLALEWILQGLGLPPEAVLAGALAFVLLGPATGFSLWDYPLVEPLALCFLTLQVGCAVHGHRRMLLLVAVVGALAKETTLLGSLFAVAWAWKQQRALLPWSLAALLESVGTQTALRLFFPSASPYTLLGAFEFSIGVQTITPYILTVLPLVEMERLLAATLGAWEIMLPLALLQLRHPPRFWRTYPAFLLLLVGAAAQIFIATDLERLAVYGFPSMIAACCFEIEYLAARWSVSRWILWPPVLLVEAYVWWFYASWPLSDGFVSLTFVDLPHRILAGGVAIAALSILAVLIRTRQRGRTSRLDISQAHRGRETQARLSKPR